MPRSLLHGCRRARNVFALDPEIAFQRMRPTPEDVLVAVRRDDCDLHRAFKQLMRMGLGGESSARVALTAIIAAGEDPVAWRDFMGGTTLLHLATNCPWMTRLLLEFGADPNVRCTARHRTPMHEAAWSSNASAAQCIQVLLDAGADPFAEDQRGITPLDFAVASAYEVIASYLARKRSQAEIDHLHVRIQGAPEHRRRL